jgi:hypothetical protein
MSPFSNQRFSQQQPIYFKFLDVERRRYSTDEPKQQPNSLRETLSVFSVLSE